MNSIRTQEKGFVIILTEAEISDIKNGLYFAMKALDKSKDPDSSDRKLSDRLEIIHDNLY